MFSVVNITNCSNLFHCQNHHDLKAQIYKPEEFDVYTISKSLLNRKPWLCPINSTRLQISEWSCFSCAHFNRISLCWDSTLNFMNKIWGKLWHHPKKEEKRYFRMLWDRSCKFFNMIWEVLGPAKEIYPIHRTLLCSTDDTTLFTSPSPSPVVIKCLILTSQWAVYVNKNFPKSSVLLGY